MPSTASVIDQVAPDLGRVVGSEHVLTDPAILADYERATFETSQRIVLVVRPASSVEV